MTVIRPATLLDTMVVARSLCYDDLVELSATRDALDADRLAIDAMSAAIKKIAYVDGCPAMVFGVYFVDDQRVTVWGFKTDRGCRAIREVTKHIRRRIIPDLRSYGVDTAACLVHSENQRSLKWLASLGFRREAIRPGLGTRNRDIPLCAMVRRENDLFARA